MSPTPEWEWMVSRVLALLALRRITPARAESWLWALIEFAEVTYERGE